MTTFEDYRSWRDNFYSCHVKSIT